MCQSIDSEQVTSIFRPIRVVHVASGDLWAGAEVQLFRLAKELNRRNSIALTVVLLNHGILEECLRKHGVHVIVFDESRLNSLQILYRLTTLLRQAEPDVVHTHRQKENVLGSVASLVAGVRCIRSVRGAEEFTYKIWQIHKHAFGLLDWCCGRYLQECMVAVSLPLGQALKRRFPHAAIHVIENGIPVDEIGSTRNVDITLPSPPGVIRVAFIGRLVPVKRLDIFLEVAQILIERNRKAFAFYIFGEGPLLGRIQHTISRLGIEGHVFMMGFRTDILSYLANMDVLLITSDHEGLPNNLLEALALEVPVVAHAVGGIVQALRGGECGTLILAHDAEAYALAILQHAQDVSDGKRRASEGRKWLEQRYSTARNASEHERLYKRLCLGSEELEIQ